MLFDLQHLYQQGGRAFWIHNTGPVGCLPVNLFYVSNNPPAGYLDEYGCVKAQNEMAVEFNKQLKDRVIKLRTELPEAAVTYVDVHTAKMQLISNAKNLGKSIILSFDLKFVMILFEVIVVMFVVPSASSDKLSKSRTC